MLQYTVFEVEIYVFEEGELCLQYIVFEEGELCLQYILFEEGDLCCSTLYLRKRSMFVVHCI